MWLRGSAMDEWSTRAVNEARSYVMERRESCHISVHQILLRSAFMVGFMPELADES